MIILNILLATLQPADSLQLERVADSRYSQTMKGVEIHIEVVTTLREVREHAHKANAIMLHLTLEDAGPEEVIAAIPELPEPVIIFTKIKDEEIHSRCLTAGAIVLIEGVARPAEVCCSLIHCLGRSIMNAMKHLP